MLVKFLVRGAIATGVVAAGVHLVRKHNLVARGTAAIEDLATKVNDGADDFVKRVVNRVDEKLSEFAETITDPAEKEKLDAFRDKIADYRTRQAAAASAAEEKVDPWTFATRDPRPTDPRRPGGLVDFDPKDDRL